jgi:hypothetical protein
MSGYCKLQTLIASKADIDDFEAHLFILPLKTNPTITELDLSNNKIGTSENLNTVLPDIITGHEVNNFVLYRES